MMIKKIILMACVLFACNASAQSLDTQYSEDGMEVHILKASIAHDVLTIVFAFENTSDEDITASSMPIEVVAFNTSDKNYPVLKDSNKKWLASTVAYGITKSDFFSYKDQSSDLYTFTVKAGKKKIGWVKFEAPSDQDWPLSLSFPAVTPFSIPKPQ